MSGRDVLPSDSVRVRNNAAMASSDQADTADSAAGEVLGKNPQIRLLTHYTYSQKMKLSLMLIMHEDFLYDFYYSAGQQ